MLQHVVHRGDWYVATADFIVEAPLFGANAVQIIVPQGIKWSAPDGLGHCNLYQMGITPTLVTGGFPSSTRT